MEEKTKKSYEIIIRKLRTTIIFISVLIVGFVVGIWYMELSSNYVKDEYAPLNDLFNAGFLLSSIAWILSFFIYIAQLKKHTKKTKK